MLEITVDVYSGRPNPSWSLPDDKETGEILAGLARERDAVEPVGSGYQGLGFRGVIIKFTNDGLAIRYGLPPSFQIANRESNNVARGVDSAERLIMNTKNFPPRVRPSAKAAKFNAALEKSLLGKLHTMAVLQDRTQPDTGGWLFVLPPGSPPGTVPVLAKWPATKCEIETRSFDPAFWNDPAHMALNNCYNYATNRRTDTLSQPGGGAGAPIASYDCAGVEAAALADGARKRGKCCPDTEKPRWLIALVTDPGTWGDYHWYRLHSEGFWGHKPGRTGTRTTIRGEAAQTCSHMRHSIGSWWPLNPLVQLIDFPGAAAVKPWESGYHALPHPETALCSDPSDRVGTGHRGPTNLDR